MKRNKIFVLMHTTLSKVGNKGEIISVKPGFARNFLEPKNYASILQNDKVNVSNLTKSSKLDETVKILKKIKEVKIPVKCTGKALSRSYSKYNILSFISKNYKVNMNKIFTLLKTDKENVSSLGVYKLEARINNEIIEIAINFIPA